MVIKRKIYILDWTNKAMEKKMFEEFNKMYKLPVNKIPTLLPIERLKAFSEILAEEINESKEIIKLQELALTPAERLKVLAEIADWFGDIIWYVNSEAIKYGIDVDEVLSIIKESNASKLNAQGRPIYDDRGKVMRGPNYFEPQTKILKFLKEKDLNI